MQHNVVTPSVGESITEVSILKWHKLDGQRVKTGDLLLEIESDKATVELIAEHGGVLSILKQPGERLPIGATIGLIDDAAAERATAGPAPQTEAKTAPQPTPAMSAAATAQPLSPSVRRLTTETGVDPSRVPGTGKDGRVTKGDVIHHLASGRATTATPSEGTGATHSQDRPGDRRVPMSMLRARIAERLVQAQHTAAILTTFNEVDMTAVMDVRNKHKDAFKARHQVPLSFMSFFTRACVEALKLIPEVNASIDGRDVLYHDYQDMGIAVGTDRGLVVPVIRDAGKMGFVAIEKELARLAEKARAGKLSMAELSGGTFTISNGGVYGSLLSTPILNMPQTGILGMHKIQDRPIVVEKDGKKSIEIRPMMYLALSYDHRLVDGKGAVTFLIHVKTLLETPSKLGLDF